MGIIVWEEKTECMVMKFTTSAYLSNPIGIQSDIPHGMELLVTIFNRVLLSSCYS